MTNDNMNNTSDRMRLGVLIGILIGIAIMIAIAGMNLYEMRRQRSELNDQFTQLAKAINSRPSGPAAPARANGPDPEKVYTVKTEGAPSEGLKSAPITIVEISEFQCPFCAKVSPTLKQVREVYKDKVQFVWKHLPLTNIHQNAMGAAVASEAAKNQDKFWPYHDKLFANQAKLSTDDLKQYARDLGMDMGKFEADLTNPNLKQRVADDIAEVNKLGVSGTPGFFVNGRFISGAQPFDGFAKVINAELQRLNLPVPPAPKAIPAP